MQNIPTNTEFVKNFNAARENELKAADELVEILDYIQEKMNSEDDPTKKQKLRAKFNFIFEIKEKLREHEKVEDEDMNELILTAKEIKKEIKKDIEEIKEKKNKEETIRGGKRRNRKSKKTRKSSKNRRKSRRRSRR